MRYFHAVIAIVVVLTFHALGMGGFYEAWHYYDVPMHFGGGVAMAVLAWALWDHQVQSFTLVSKHAWARWAFFALFLLGFTAIIGIGWEWFEFSFDRWVQPALRGWAVAQTSMFDTMADFFFDLLGALVVALFRRKV